MGNLTVQGLEQQLAGTLKPVRPRREFVSGLGRRIHNWKKLLLDTSRETWKSILLVLMGLLSLAIFLALIGRSLYQLLGIKKQNPSD